MGLHSTETKFSSQAIEEKAYKYEHAGQLVNEMLKLE